MNQIPFMKEDGEVPLWATERKQLPSKQWVITVWLNDEREDLSNAVHKEIARVVKRMTSKTILDKSGREVWIDDTKTVDFNWSDPLQSK